MHAVGEIYTCIAPFRSAEWKGKRVQKHSLTEQEKSYSVWDTDPEAFPNDNTEIAQAGTMKADLTMQM